MKGPVNSKKFNFDQVEDEKETEKNGNKNNIFNSVILRSDNKKNKPEKLKEKLIDHEEILDEIIPKNSKFA